MSAVITNKWKGLLEKEKKLLTLSSFFPELYTPILYSPISEVWTSNPVLLDWIQIKYHHYLHDDHIKLLHSFLRSELNNASDLQEEFFCLLFIFS